MELVTQLIKNECRPVLQDKHWSKKGLILNIASSSLLNNNTYVKSNSRMTEYVYQYRMCMNTVPALPVGFRDALWYTETIYQWGKRGE